MASMSCLIQSSRTGKEKGMYAGIQDTYCVFYIHRCSPLSFAGPKRYTEPPCKLDELPRIDAVIISHNQLSSMHAIMHLQKLIFYIDAATIIWMLLLSRPSPINIQTPIFMSLSVIRHGSMAR